MPKDAMDDALERLKGELPAAGLAPDRVWGRIRESLELRPRRLLLAGLARAAAFLAGFGITLVGLGGMTRSPAREELSLAARLAPAATARPEPGPEAILHRPTERLFEGFQR